MKIKRRCCSHLLCKYRESRIWTCNLQRTFIRRLQVAVSHDGHCLLREFKGVWGFPLLGFVYTKPCWET